MKPNFALDLSHDGIGLLHRAKSGWTLIGEVALDDPEMQSQLEVLRKTAADLESGGITSKLIIPNSQILYATLDAKGPDDIAREVQIREGLEGMTPYKVGDLVFDWRPAKKGKQVHVAVIARETLDEAEAFAHDHRMNPVSFVARPQKPFRGEAFFGKTKEAAALLGPGGQLEPDEKPVPATRKPAKAAEDAEDAPKPEKAETPPEKADTPKKPKSADALENEAVQQDGGHPAKNAARDAGKRSEPAEAKAAPAPGVTTASDDRAHLSPLDDKTLEALLAEVPEPAGFSKKKGQSDASAQRSGADADDASPQPPILAPFPPTPEDDEDAPPAPRKPRKKRIKKKPEPEASPREEPKLGDTPGKPVPAEAATVPAFSSRRIKAEDDDPPLAKPDLKDPTESAGPDKAKRPLIVRGNPTTTAPASTMGTAPVQPPEKIRELLKRKAEETPNPATKGKAVPPPAVLARKGFGQRLANLAGDPKPGIPATPPPSPKRKGADTAIAPGPEADETDALTVFGARRTREVGGKPRYLGLILTLVLLLIMAIAAIWSVFFLSDGDASLFNSGGIDAPAAVSVTQPEATEPVLPADPATPDATALAAATDPVLPPIDPNVAASIDELLADIEPEQDAILTDETTGEVLTDEAAQARYAATGVWQKAPQALSDPEGDRIDELYIASIDPAIASQDAVALPPINAVEDARPPSPLPPPPEGSEFALNDQGLVEPTPEGTLTPDGFMVFSGRPPVVAPLRPQLAEQPAPTDAEIPRVRPKPRPEGLVEGLERANLGGNTRAELAEFRPRARPASAQSQEPDSGVPNELAVAMSPKPGRRPGGFQKIVEQARSRAAASDGSVVVAAAAATTSPTIPTRASVATQATVKNAINLRKVNLIGIYGSSSSRRALVRLSNGRYVKVSIGDRLDGGKVTAITSEKLIYQKRGRNYTLKVLPLG